MKRPLLVSVALTSALSFMSMPVQAFNLFNVFSKNDINSMLPYVPADTAMFFGGVTNADLYEQMDDWMDQALAEQGAEDFSQLISEISDSEHANFFSQFMSDYYAASSQGMDALIEQYGLKTDGASAVYLDGLFPVIRIAVADSDAMLNELNKSASAVDYTIQSQNLGKNTIHVFPIVDDEDVDLSVGLLVSNKILTISFFTDLDSEADLEQRFALSKPDSALGKADWKALGDTYDLDENLRGYISLVEMTRVFLDSNTKGAQQLAAISSEGLPTDEFSDACKAETLALAAGAPRFIIGTQSFEIEDGVFDMAITTALEIANQPVLTDLKNLMGFVPDYVSNNDALSLGMAFGLNMDTLVPSLTSLWTQFTSADFDCEALQDAQASLKEVNPAMLSVVTGFTNGVKGLSFGLFNFDAQDAMETLALDALVTLSAEDPSMLASLISSYVPFLKGQAIPTNGDPIALPLPLPIETFVAIKGQHLVVYTGDTAKQEAEALAAQPLETNGISAMTLDYKQLGELMMNSAQALTQYQQSSGKDAQCTDLYYSAVILQNLDMRLSGFDQVTEQGMVSRYNIRMDYLSLMETASISIIGSYDVEYIDDDCNWYFSGVEELATDNTGSYFEADDSGSCNVYESSYDWSFAMGQLSQTDSQGRYRDSCDSEWEQDDSYDFSCSVVGASDGQFYCLEAYEGEKTLYRYTAK